MIHKNWHIFCSFTYEPHSFPYSQLFYLTEQALVYIDSVKYRLQKNKPIYFNYTCLIITFEESTDCYTQISVYTNTKFWFNR